MILTVGYLNTEAERARRDAEAAQPQSPAPGFQAMSGLNATDGDLPTMADSMVAEIQSYLTTEQAIADEFVARPTSERLHRSSKKLKIRKTA